MTNKEKMTKAVADFKAATRGEDVRQGIEDIGTVAVDVYDDAMKSKDEVLRAKSDVDASKRQIDEKVAEVSRTGNTAVNEINQKKTSAVNDIDRVKISTIQSVGNAGSSAVSEINSTKDTAKSEITQTKDAAKNEIAKIATDGKQVLESTISRAEQEKTNLETATSKASTENDALQRTIKNTDNILYDIEAVENELKATTEKAKETNKKLQGNLEGSDLSGLQKLTKENKAAVDKVASDLQTAKTDLERKIDNKDLSAYATKSELTSYAKKSDLNDYAIAHEVESAFDEIHSDYATNSKVSELESKVDKAFQSASEGKRKIAAAITGKGGSASSNDSFSQLASEIDGIKTGYGAGDILTNSNFDVIDITKSKALFSADNSIQNIAVDGEYIYVVSNKYIHQYKNGQKNWEASADEKEAYIVFDNQHNMYFKARYDRIAVYDSNGSYKYGITGYCDDMKSYKNDLYVAQGSSGLVKFRNNSKIKSYSGQAESVDVRNDKVYVNSKQGVTILDLDLNKQSYIDAGSYYGKAIAATDDAIYFAENNENGENDIIKIVGSSIAWKKDFGKKAIKKMFTISNNAIAVLFSSGRWKVIDKDGNLINSFSEKASICCTSNGDIYIADETNVSVEYAVPKLKIRIKE